MIQVIGTKTPSGLKLETSEKVNGKKQSTVVYNEADIDRLYYFWVRLYIIERMSAFLKQRIKAFQIAKFHSFEDVAADLLREIQNYNLTALYSLCNIIVRNEEKIAAIAPGQKSKHYKYYSSTILSIIAFCKNPEGGSHEPAVEHAA